MTRPSKPPPWQRRPVLADMALLGPVLDAAVAMNA